MDGSHFPLLSVRRKLDGRWARPTDFGLEAQLAIGDHLNDVSYRLRYQAYKNGGFIPDNEHECFSDEYDAYGNCRTAVVFKDGVPAATVRVTRHDPASDGSDRHELPAMKMFGAEIQAVMSALSLPARPPRVLEINRLARAPSFAKDLDVVFALFRVAGYLFLDFDADIVFNAVRAHHVPMYRRFGFQQLEEPRQYPGLAMKTGLMASFRPGHAALIEGQPFLRGITTSDDVFTGLMAGERVPIFGRPDLRTQTYLPECLTAARPAA